MRTREEKERSKDRVSYCISRNSTNKKKMRIKTVPAYVVQELLLPPQATQCSFHQYSAVELGCFHYLPESQVMDAEAPLFACRDPLVYGKELSPGRSKRD